MAYIPPNPRRVGCIVPIHGPLDVPLYMGSIYTNSKLFKQQTIQDPVYQNYRNYHITRSSKKIDITSSLPHSQHPPSNTYYGRVFFTSLMHSGPSKDVLPIAGVTGYQTYRQINKYNYTIKISRDIEICYYHNLTRKDLNRNVNLSSARKCSFLRVKEQIIDNL